jgi:hypothetical protein
MVLSDRRRRTETDLLMPNALTDIAWIDSTDGPLTPREALVRAHEIAGGVAGFDPLLSGVRIGAQFRFLMGLTALVVREQGEAGDRFSPDAVDAVLARLFAVSDPFDADRPFLQQWRTGAEKDLEVSFKAPTALNLAVESASAQSFWSIGQEKWVLAKALHSLLEFGTYAPASNNRIHGRSCWNSSPGRGWVPGNLPSTELVWTKDTMFEALLLNTPKTWAAGTGLPFWADRTGANASGADGLHPMWTATWTGNIVIGEWAVAAEDPELTELTGVAVGGTADYSVFLGFELPEFQPRPETADADLAVTVERVSAEANADQKLTRKEAMYIRDLNDPLRIIEDRLKDGELHRTPYRMDPAESASRVLVSWKSKNLSPAMSDRGQKAIRQPGRDGHRIVFLVHEYAGTASSPQLRFSQHRQMSAIEWIDADDRAEEVTDLAKRIDMFAFANLASLFGKDRPLYTLRPYRAQFLATFWDEVTEPFHRFITVSDEFVLPAEAHADIRAAVRTTFQRMQKITPLTDGGIILLATARDVDFQALRMFPAEVAA